MTTSGEDCAINGERLISVGIDIGTSTTQCVFSALQVANTASPFLVPKIQIASKEVTYRSPVRLTPFSDQETIDAFALESMLREDYRRAGVSPQDIRCGALIMTGEAAKKSNARAVSEVLSPLAGDFVPVVAGPALEGILAGRGSGAAQLSRTTGKSVLNLDVGGGTVNLCLFSRGEPIAQGCVAVGGRLLRFDQQGDVSAIQGAMPLLAQELGISLAPGRYLSAQDRERLAGLMVRLVEEEAHMRPRSPLHQKVVMDCSLPADSMPGIITFSGGVADCVYGACAHQDIFHDMGTDLGMALSRSLFFEKSRVLRPAETMHATVIGAGIYAVAVSGSTIAYQGVALPIKSLPVAKVLLSQDEDIAGLSDAIIAQRRVFDLRCAIGVEGIKNPSFAQIEAMADAVVSAFSHDGGEKIIISHEDMAKALGQAVLRRLGQSASLLCIDGISLSYGDMVDIGEPVADGRALPVIVKTLAFPA